jgi:pyruvate dehydrogenase E2 component (dihydrolipoyllysine-residue acetyltransferase)
MAETITMPKLGFDMAEGTLVRWVKKVGESVNKGDVLAEIETDKATVEVESSASGVVRRLLVEEGAVVPVNSPIALVGTADEKLDEPAPVAIAQPPTTGGQTGSAPLPDIKPVPVEPMVVESKTTALNQQSSTASPLGRLKVSPLARKIARDRSIDLSNVRGSGPGGRIVRRDVESALSGQVPLVAGQTSPSPLPSDYSTSRPSDQTLPLSKLRQIIARRMAESKTTVPHFYVTHEFKVDSLLDLRRQLNNMLPENEKVSVNDFIVKAVALTLRQFPNLNASLNGNSVLRHGSTNIGIAVSVEGGLLTIVCQDADRKPLRQVSAEVKVMAAHVREGKVRPAEIEGSTFSISNMGMYDVENFAAIINPPEVGILAVGSAREVPVVENGSLKTGWRMKATISVDHRVSDGVEAAKFMQALAVFLEEPLRLVI